MQPRGLGIPAILAAVLAGPLGKSWYSSLMGTPEVLPSTRTVGPVPFASYSARMNLMTCQCRSVSGPIPAAWAICGAISSVHSSGCSKNPSSLTATVWPAYVAVVMGVSSSRLCAPGAVSRSHRRVLAALGHWRAHAGDVPSGQQAVPVEPLEPELAEVVEP